MPNYEEFKCPVCNKQFTKDDDIVTCPECGTPHHRECYMLSGHCVNQGLHATGYSFLQDHKPIIPEPTVQAQAKTGEYYAPPVDNSNNQQVPFGQSQNGEEQNQPPFQPFQTIQFDVPQYQEQGEIDGVSINDIAATVRTNPQRFVEKFKKFSQKKSKLSWNWGAFFFGSYYLLFRKMYKQGIAFFCIMFSAVLVGDAALFKFAPKYMAAMQDLVTNYDPKSTAMPDISSITGASDAQTAITVMYILLAVLLLIRIIIAAYADYFYKGTVFNIIKTVSEQLDNGANFIQSSIFGAEANLDQGQMKRMYLGNKGGVTLFAPLVAYFIMYVVTSLF
ncbi:RING finger protein [uncultured Eubacterium sp.]|uniref:RING finger protein n=1 Tax=uncultured Eubacterium sp. TaxID=165185 RepID=UPI0026332DD4|nr:RING finger protein [uncultured Eubacterium sp.]